MVFGRAGTEEIGHVLGRVGNGPRYVFAEPSGEVPEFVFIDRCPHFDGADPSRDVSNGEAIFAGVKFVEPVDRSDEPRVIAPLTDQRGARAVDDVVFDEPGHDVVPRSAHG